jgi:transposase-like protein
MTERRRYTKRDKVKAVTAALASSVTAAAEATGIPATTIDYWMDRPEFVKLREKTQDDLAAEMKGLSHLAASLLAARLSSGEVDTRDLIVALGVTTDKAQLLSGHATARTENRSLSDGLTDHEKQQLRDGLDRLLADAPAESPGEPAVGAGAEVRE